MSIEAENNCLAVVHLIEAGVLRNILGRAVPVGPPKPLPHYHLPRPPTSISTFLNSKEKPIRR